MSEEKKPLWSGRFTTGLERRVAGFTSSLELDHRIALHDVRGSLAHARMLGRQRILTEKEAKTIEDGLTQIVHEIEQSSFPWPTDFEDVHTVIERRLRDLVGEVAGKLHTGRSRNDQIALDLRLFTIDSLAIAADGKAFVTITVTDPTSTPPTAPFYLLLVPSDRGYLVDDILLPLVATIGEGG